MATVQPAQRVLSFLVPGGDSYVDIADCLSKVNRRAYRQGMKYAIGKIEFAFIANQAQISVLGLAVKTAGDTWVVQNSWKKAQAHWLQQQRRARKLIGQSAKPAYEDFKVYLDDAHRAGDACLCVDSENDVVSPGEWDYSVLIWEADDHSIDECFLHLIGGDVAATDKGLILAYQQSRATVQAESPDLPNEYSTNLYALMGADQDAVADEVADNMEYRNDETPYDQDDYPGNDTNADHPWIQELQVASAGMPNATLDGFVAECGLLKFELNAYDANAVPVDLGNSKVGVFVTLVPGSYKGIMAKPMGQ